MKKSKVIAISVSVVVAILVVVGVICLIVFLPKDSSSSGGSQAAAVTAHHVIFAHNCCSTVSARVKSTALKNKVTTFTKYGLDDMGFDEARRNIVLKGGRGGGYWTWKARSILNRMNSPDVREGDLVVYTDASAYFTKPYVNLKNSLVDGRLFVSSGADRKFYTRLDAVAAILPEKSKEEFCSEKPRNQVQSGTIAMIKNKENIAFLEEWDRWLADIQLFNDSPSKIPNCPVFVESRHDQMILDLLIEKYGFEKSVVDGPTGKKIGFDWHRVSDHRHSLREF
jgi:hypothetical protein